MSHIDMEDDHIDTVISHIISPYPISISRMTIIQDDHIDVADNHIDILYPISISHISCRCLISISHIDIGSYLVILGRACQMLPASDVTHRIVYSRL